MTVESGKVDEIFHAPKHPYTRMLLNAMPRIDSVKRELSPAALTADKPLLNVDDLEVYFPIKKRGLFAGTKPLRAVDGVSLQLRPGETLGIVGELVAASPRWRARF